MGAVIKYKKENTNTWEPIGQDKIAASGILKGDGNGNIESAVDGTDYIAPGSLKTINGESLIGTDNISIESNTVLIGINLITDQSGAMSVECDEYTVDDLFLMADMEKTVFLWAFTGENLSDTIYFAPDKFGGSPVTFTWTGVDANGRHITISAVSSNTWTVTVDTPVEFYDIRMHYDAEYTWDDEQLDVIYTGAYLTDKTWTEITDALYSYKFVRLYDANDRVYTYAKRGNVGPQIGAKDALYFWALGTEDILTGSINEYNFRWIRLTCMNVDEPPICTEDNIAAVSLAPTALDVTCTFTSETGGTCDKTTAEIKIAMDQGRVVYFKGAMPGIGNVRYLATGYTFTSSNEIAIAAQAVGEPNGVFYDFFMPFQANGNSFVIAERKFLDTYIGTEYAGQILRVGDDGLVQHSELKTINGTSLIGSGDISLPDEVATDAEVTQMLNTVFGS